VRRILLAAVLALVCAAGTARAGDGPVLGFTAAASPSAPRYGLPSAATPNSPGAISVPTAFTIPPATTQQLSLPALHALWQRAGATYGIPWQVLASINKIESNFGQNMGPSSAGAIGWMQFMPDTWLRWGVDADGNGVADPWSAADAVFAAARYLAASGGQTDIRRAIYSYNHADWYVNEVLQLANVYGRGGAQETANLQQLQAALDSARLRVVDANRIAVAAIERERSMELVSSRLHVAVDSAAILSDRLVAEQRAAQYDLRLHEVQNANVAAHAALQDAEAKLATAQRNADAPSFAPGAASILGAPSFGDGYVFPVGGGPGVVSAAHTHHDYPAVDIAAPEGTPVYALADSVVLNAWHSIDPRCGIGMTIRASDGQDWTYCHLSFLAPDVLDGARLSAGQQVGLVGHTGDATGPHLHLQLQPATAWPQEEGWFQRFAGRAFRWQDAPTRGLQAVAAPSSGLVFAVVSGDSEPVVSFTR
jgi:murein DD-endopeptidase MepM/ murein hydrolase activator NlpD